MPSILGMARKPNRSPLYPSRGSRTHGGSVKQPKKGSEVKRIKAVAMCAALGVAVAGLAFAAPSYADPVSNSYVLVGSDTLQDAGNALSNGTSISGANVRVLAGKNTVGSFDAFGSAAIQAKPSGVYFARPAGSGDGVKALSRSIDGGLFSVAGNATPAVSIAGQVDIARSSSSAGTSANTSGTLAYIPFGRDALSYAYVGNGLGNITGAQLKSIYECTLSSIGGVAVTPVLPQLASGTRKFFLSAIGNPSLGSCVVQNGVAENDGTVITNGQIIPFSVASFVAQSNGAGLDRTGSASLGSPLGSIAPFTGSGTSLVPNSAYYSSTVFGRDTYVVVEYARINDKDPKYDATLASIVDPTKTKSLTNFTTLTPSTAGSVKTKFGFLAPSSTTLVRANPTP